MQYDPVAASRRFVESTIATVEAHFADRDPRANLPFQSLGVANPIIGWFPVDFGVPIVAPLDRPYGGISGCRGIQNQTQRFCLNVVFWPFCVPPTRNHRQAGDMFGQDRERHRLVGGTYRPLSDATTLATSITSSANSILLRGWRPWRASYSR